MVTHRTPIVDRDSPNVARHSKLGQSKNVFQGLFSIFVNRCSSLIDAWPIRSSLDQFAFKRLSSPLCFSSSLSESLLTNLVMLLNGFTISWEPCPVIPYLFCFYLRSGSVLISRKGCICIRLDEMVQYGPQNMEARQNLTKSVGSPFVFGGCLHVCC